MNRWYVLHVRTNEEQDVKRVINREIPVAGVKVFKRIIQEKKQGEFRPVERLMFPGYVFINVEMTEKVYYTLEKVPGVIRVLDMKKGMEEIIPVPDEEMDFILSFTDENDTVNISEVFLMKSGRIKVTDGALVGFYNRIIKFDKAKRRVTVAIELFGKTKEITFSVNLK